LTHAANRERRSPKLVVGISSLFDDGVLLCDRHRIGVMMDTLTRARSAKRKEGMTAGAAGIHRCFTGNPPYSNPPYCPRSVAGLGSGVGSSVDAVSLSRGVE
jgi:hypothetical protein